MTPGDFELIAATVRAGRYVGMDRIRHAIANDEARRFANALASTNPAFDRERFLKACGFEEMKAPQIEYLRRAD